MVSLVVLILVRCLLVVLSVCIPGTVRPRILCAVGSGCSVACFSPLHGYRSRSVGSSGKRAVVFNVRDGFVDMPVVMPCGHCFGCRLERSRQWAIRCMHEASLYTANAFVTLTYSEDELPAGGSLDRDAFPLFMKRLRRRIDERVRYYHCGEYGDRTGRPHYHACLFGFDFPDKTEWSVRRGLPVYRSALLEDLWPFGNSEIGSVTFESAAYVARYVMKKVYGENAWLHYQSLDLESGEVSQVEPEYTTMSRRPGIGKPWLERYMSDVYPEDGVVVNGRLMKPPRYYDLQFELVNEPGALDVARERRRKRREEDETPERLSVREQVARGKLALSERGLE